MKVLVIGCFDPLHYGHLHLLHAANAVSGTKEVIVGLTTDLRLSKEKPGHPFFNWEMRHLGLLRTGSVSQVVAHEGSDIDTINLVRPKILMMGYNSCPQIGVEGLVDVLYFKTWPQLSSSELLTGKYLERIRVTRQSKE